MQKWVFDMSIDLNQMFGEMHVSKQSKSQKIIEGICKVKADETSKMSLLVGQVRPGS